MWPRTAVVWELPVVDTKAASIHPVTLSRRAKRCNYTNGLGSRLLVSGLSETQKLVKPWPVELLSIIQRTFRVRVIELS